MTKEQILNDLINYKELGKQQTNYVRVFNYNVLNKTIYYYYNLNNKKHNLSLDEFISEAYFFILSNIDNIRIDYNTDKDKYINYLNKSIANNYKAMYNKGKKESCLYIEDIYNDKDNTNNITPIECIKDNSNNIKEYFPVDNTYNEYLNYLLVNKEKIFNDKEILILNDIILNNFKYSEEVKQMLKDINTTKYLYNHKISLMGKINRRYTIYLLLKELDEDIYENVFKYIYKDKNINNLLLSDNVNKDKLKQLLEYRLYKKEYFINKYDCRDIYEIGRLNIYMYVMKKKLYEEIGGVVYGN